MNVAFWVLLAIVYVLSIFIVGFIAQQAGIEQGEKKAKEELGSGPTYNVAMNFDAEEFQKQIEALQERMSLLDTQVQTFDERQKSAPVNLSMGAERRLNEIEPLLERVAALEERERAYNDRFRRVERKAGMNV